MKTKKQKRVAAIQYMQNARGYSIAAVARRFNIPYNTVWTYDKNLKAGKYSSSKTIDRALRLVRTVEGNQNVSDGSSADYYVLPEDANELQDLISHKNMNAQIGEIFRSCYRYGQPLHSDMLRDAKKIKFYAEAEIKRLEKLNEGKN